MSRFAPPADWWKVSSVRTARSARLKVSRSRRRPWDRCAGSRPLPLLRGPVSGRPPNMAALHAKADLRGHDFPRHRAQRRLPISEPLDAGGPYAIAASGDGLDLWRRLCRGRVFGTAPGRRKSFQERSEEHTSELQSHHDLVCRLLLEKKK